METIELTCKDLMIGDSVLVKPSKMLINIIAIHHNKVAYHACIGKLTWVGEGLLEPILLTPEILEKNGFEVTRNMSLSGNKDVWSLCVSKDKVFHIIEHHNKRQFPYFWIEIGSNSDIKYVHQLQHALKLCGIGKEIKL